MNDPQRPRVCVFCGSSVGIRPEYAEAARQVGSTLALQGVGIVYGGGKVGLMGVVADAAIEAGGEVIGVIPEPLARKEVAHDGLAELRVVPDMHTRKAMMAQLSQGFLTLPGGVGTFEEFFEIYTWAVLGLHRKPIGLLNVNGYFDPLLQMLQRTVDERFLASQYLDVVRVSDNPAVIASQLLNHVPPPLGPKWISLAQS